MKNPKPAKAKEVKRRGLSPGRKRVWGTEMPVYDSMEQASAASGIPKTALQHAKKNGCLFVRHGRVHIGEFVRWWWSQDVAADETIDAWDKRDKRAVALTRETKLELLREESVPWLKTDQFIKWMTGVAFFGELERLAHEFPAILKGKTEVEIHREVLNQVEKVKKSISSQADAWLQKKGKL